MDPGFQVRRGAHLQKLRRAEGDSKIFGVFRVKNHDFSNFRGGGGASRVLPLDPLLVLVIRSRVLNTSLNIYFSCILLNSYTSLTRFIIESCVYTRMVCGLVETQPRRWCNG